MHDVLCVDSITVPLISERNNDVNRRNVYGKCHLIRLITLLLVRTIKSKYLRKNTSSNLFKCAIKKVIEQEDYETKNSFYSLSKSIERS